MPVGWTPGAPVFANPNLVAAPMKQRSPKGIGKMRTMVMSVLSNVVELGIFIAAGAAMVMGMLRLR